MARHTTPQRGGAFWWALAVFIAILADGALRKWFLPNSLRAIPYFAKDVLAVLFIVTHPVPVGARRWVSRLLPFVIGITVCLFPALLLGSLRVPEGAVVAFKNAVVWPLFAIRMGACLSQSSVSGLTRIAAISSLMMAPLGVVQYTSSPLALVNRYAWDVTDTPFATQIATAGESVRATGSFSYISGMTSFALAMFCLLLGRTIVAGRGAEFWYAISGCGAAMVCGLVSGSRSVEVMIAVVTMVTTVLVPKQQIGRLAGGLMVMGAVGLLVWNSSLAEGVLSRWQTTGGGEVESRIFGTSTGQPIVETIVAEPIGIGLGLYTGYAALLGLQSQLPYNESAANRVAAEAGILGITAVLLGVSMILRAAVWTAEIDAVRRTRVIPLAAGLLFQVALVTWYDHVTSAVWWWACALWLGEAFSARTQTKSPSTGRRIQQRLTAEV